MPPLTFSTSFSDTVELSSSIMNSTIPNATACFYQLVITDWHPR